MSEEKNERRFHGKPDRLRSSERVALLEAGRVIALCSEGIKPGRMLDVGTGTGIFAEAFLAKGFVVAGIDANDAMLEEAGRLVPDAEFKNARAEKIPYNDGAFDIVFMGLLLHETDDPVQALREARRVSKYRVAILEWPYIKDGPGPPLDHRLRPERILDIAKQAGLEQIDRQSLTHLELYRMAVAP